MGNIFGEISKYLMIVLFAIYTYSGFAVFRKKYNKERRENSDGAHSFRCFSADL